MSLISEDVRRGFNISCGYTQGNYEDEKKRKDKELKREVARIKEFNSGSLLFKVSRLIAEADSIGEGYAYCSDYTKKIYEEDTEYKKLAKQIIGLCKAD